MSDIEQAVRGLVRDELARVQGVPAARSLSAKAIANAVRAELARAGKKHVDLVEVLGLSRPTIWGRLNGAYEFKRDELEKIGAFLGITSYNLIESAAMGERFATEKPEAIEVARVTQDPWVQPPGSFRRRKAR